jgi:hypothetical protein
MIDALKARIKATVPAIKFVGEAADFQSAAESNPKVTPACFVIALEEMPAPNQMGDILIQKVQATVGIVLVVRNLSDSKGAAARSSMDAIRKLVKDQVYGWQATSALDPFERGSSHLLAFRDGHVWWQDIYLTSYYDRSVL